MNTKIQLQSHIAKTQNAFDLCSQAAPSVKFCRMHFIKLHTHNDHVSTNDHSHYLTVSFQPHTKKKDTLEKSRAAPRYSTVLSIFIIPATLSHSCATICPAPGSTNLLSTASKHATLNCSTIARSYLETSEIGCTSFV